jgi:hypothetical protein
MSRLPPPSTPVRAVPYRPDGATAATHAPATAGKTAGKTVSLAAAASPAYSPACNARHAHSSKQFRIDGSLYKLRGYIAYSEDNGCVADVEGHLYGWADRGRDMRVRFYDGGVVVKTLWLHGKIHSTNPRNPAKSYILYSASPYWKPAQDVCEAVFSHNNTVRITPAVCEQTGY